MFFTLVSVATAAVLLRAPPQREVGNGTSSQASCPLPAGAKWCTLYTGEGAGQKLKFACHSNPPSFQCRQICSSGSWEGLEKKLHKLRHSSVPQGSNVLDIGANIGAYTLMAAYYGFTVHAFEPLEMNIALMKASLCANSAVVDESRVTIHESLVGDQEGSCDVYQSGHSKGLGFMCCGAEECAKVDKLNNKFQKSMPILKLDSVLGPSVQGHIAFVKMDVEGAECKVLNGGTKLLAAPFHPDMIQTEVQPRGMKVCTAQEYLDRYANAGYCVHKKGFQCNSPNDKAIPVGIADYYMLSKTFKGHM
jgi:FkbM family methyltransferase